MTSNNDRPVKEVIDLSIEIPTDLDNFKSFLNTLKAQSNRTLEGQFSAESNTFRIYDTTAQILFDVRINPNLHKQASAIIANFGSANTLYKDLSNKQWGFFAVDGLAIYTKIRLATFLEEKLILITPFKKEIGAVYQGLRGGLKAGLMTARLAKSTAIGLGVDLAISVSADQFKLYVFNKAMNESYKNDLLKDLAIKLRESEF